MSSIDAFLLGTLRRIVGPLSAKRRREAAAQHALEAAARADLVASGLFDAAYYLAHSPDVAQAGMDPAFHYLHHGWREGRQPSAAFDGDFYLGVHADVRAQDVNPLLHYARFGRDEARAVRANAAAAPAPLAATEAAWQALLARLDALPRQPAALDVVVPVYRGYAETAHCLYTLAASRLEPGPPFEILVVDDATPEPALAGLLERLAARGVVTLLRNASNAGFVRSVNLGMAQHRSRDVILLNADTEVHGDWIARLARAAYARPDIGSVTPWSNNATFCSYPAIGRVFAGAFEVGFAEIDRLAAAANAGRTYDLPAARGFCVYLRRACLDAVGEFDAAAFGRGHGEETDFSRRALARGWRAVLAADVFVRHLGNVSFGASAAAHGRRAVEVLRTRYPGYLEEEAAFVRDDPLLEARRSLSAARFARASRRAILFVVRHGQGGTERHVAELTAMAAAQGVGALLLRPAPGTEPALELSHAAIAEATGTLRLRLTELPYAARLLRDLGVFHIHLHHLLGFPEGSEQFVRELAAAAGISLDVTIHDYLFISPPRAQYETLLRGARRVFVPDEDVRSRVAAALPGLAITVRAHPEPVPAQPRAPRARRPGEVLRVAVIGALSAQKGADRVLLYARHAAEQRLGVCYVVIAGAQSLAEARLPSIEPRFIGRCSEEALPGLIAESACHVALFASAIPETYSYTLSQAFFSGLYPVAFDVGAIARRIRAAGWGRVLPLECIDDAARVNAALLECEVPPLPAAWPPVAGRAAYPSLERDYYGLRP